MSVDNVSSIVAAVTALLAGFFSLFFTRLIRLDAGRVNVEFARAELSVRESLEQSMAVADEESKGITWDDLEKGNFRDNELRARFDQLQARTRRLERASERLGVRRQALLETYHNQGLSQSRVSFAFALAGPSRIRRHRLCRS